MTDIEETSTLAEQFAEGLRSGELLIQVCRSCGRPNMYPRYYCPFCQSADLSYKSSSGVGILHSYTIVRAVPPRGFEAELPYALGVVKLEEGVQLIARLEPGVNGEWDEYACDADVRFVPTPEHGGRQVAWFRLEDPR